MAFDPLTEKGVPMDRQLRTWAELISPPYRTEDVHPYTRCRVIAMNGIEVEAVMYSHQVARHTADDQVKRRLALTRRIEQQQQKAVAGLVPGEESVIAHTIGYEQVAVDLTAWIARHEPDPYLKQVYEFGLLEDFDHLYRYANLMDMMGERRKAEAIVGAYTEITPGRPTIFEHRHPFDDLRRPMTKTAAERQSVLNALTVMSAEQQTMNFYMNVANRPTQPLARALYTEIAMIEEQHVSHYESIVDPTLTWCEGLLLHEFNECWLYWSCLSTETDPRIKAVWELHLAQEIEHFQQAWSLMKEVDRRDPAELLPDTRLTEPMTFEQNKAYVRRVLETQVDLTADGPEFVPIERLPEGHRYFRYQTEVNDDAAVPTEQVIAEHKRQFGGDYRFEPEGDHPVEPLRGDRSGEGLGYARAVEQHVH